MIEENRKLHRHNRSNFGIITQVEASGKVTAVVLTVQERYLGKELHKSWIFPGGSMNPGETDKENLIRELGEEISREQKVLGVSQESLRLVLQFKKPGDHGVPLTQNFWYLPMSESISLRGIEQSNLLESDGAVLGQPCLMDVGEIITMYSFKLAHLAAAVVLLGKLMDSEIAPRSYSIPVETTASIRGRYASFVEPYLTRTYSLLNRLSRSRDYRSYARFLHTYRKFISTKPQRTVEPIG